MKRIVSDGVIPHSFNDMILSSIERFNVSGNEMVEVENDFEGRQSSDLSSVVQSDNRDEFQQDVESLADFGTNLCADVQ